MAKTFDTMYVKPEMAQIANAMTRYDLDDLVTAIYARRLELIAGELKSRGIPTRISADAPVPCDGGRETMLFNLVMVYDPAGELPGEWATVEECRRLMDTVANLKPADAFRRWITKVEPVYTPPYTEANARRDCRAEREQLERDYAAGKISGEDFSLGIRFSRDYFKFVEK